MKKRSTTIRKTGSILLALWLCIALLPVNVFALEQEQPDASELEYYEEEPMYAGEVCVHELQNVAEVPATCQHSGIRAHRECVKCGALFDSLEAKEVQLQDIIIPVAEHKWDAGAVVRAASASANGIRRYTCTVCGSFRDEVIYYVPPVKTAKKLTLDKNKLQFKTSVAASSPAFMKNSRIGRIWIKAYKKKIKVSWESANNMKAVDGVIILRKTGKSKTYKEVGRIQFRRSGGGIERWDPKTSFTDKKAKKKNTAYTYVVVTYLTRNGVTYISHCSDWAAGQTTASKLKSVYKAKISKKSASLQVGGSVTLKLKYSKPKKTFQKTSFRWYSDNKSVAKVSKKGKVKAVAPGTTRIRGRLASGHEVISTVTVVGAYQPAAPKLRVDTSTDSSVTLIWNSVKYAKSYDLYRSDNGSKWKSPIRVTGTSKKVTGLKKGQLYYFYVVARNDNGKYTALSDRSNTVSQRAVVNRRQTTVTGFPTSKTLASGSTYKVNVKIGSPDGRKAKLEMKKNDKWVTEKTITLPQGAGVSSVSITFPNTWWGATTYWRLVIPQSSTSESYTSKELKITSTRKYQNPSAYVQISDSIGTHGYGYYTSSVLVNSNSSKSDHVEALIKTANKYLGDSYVNGKTGAPGAGIDASGLVIQSCYGAGVDLWPISPSTRPANCVPSIMNAKLKSITYKYVEGSTDHPGLMRGDLVFFHTGRNLVGHVAIYLGYDKIIHASMVNGKVETSTISELVKPAREGGKYGYTVAGARRIFN